MRIRKNKYEFNEGDKFNRLTVIEEVSKVNGIRYIKCKCTCGNIKDIRSGQLLHNKAKSCGCLQKEVAAITGKNNTTHAVYYTKARNIHRGIIQRCYNEKDKRYHRYGGRGITIAPEWRYDIKAFHDYVINLENYDKEGFSLDRIDNDKGYFPENLKFSTHSEQAFNRGICSRNTTGLKYISPYNGGNRFKVKYNGVYKYGFKTLDEAKAHLNKLIKLG